ncbi:hypothetical protein ANTQUA_LOCUS984 [Anthophora quadrimaculata]
MPTPRSRSPSSPFLWHLRHGTGGVLHRRWVEGCVHGTEDERASPFVEGWRRRRWRWMRMGSTIGESERQLCGPFCRNASLLESLRRSTRRYCKGS